MKHLKRYKHLAALFAVCLLAFALHRLGLPAVHCLAIVALWQLSQFALSKRCGVCFSPMLTDSQIREFEQIMHGFKDADAMLRSMRELDAEPGGLLGFKGLGRRYDELQGEVKKLRRQSLGALGNSGVRWVGGKPFVTDECAQALSSVLVVEASRMGESAMRQLNKEQRSWEAITRQARSYLGLEAKAALTTTEIPVPTIYVPQIIELVFAYGQARQRATVFPLGAGTVKLPRLKAGEDTFTYLGVGTAGMSQAVAEKKVTAELVTFTANKLGGLIRIPTELEEDTFIPVGQFLARYIARQFAKMEDSTLFIGDGTSTYANILGVGPYCAANSTYLLQLAAGKTKPSDATLADFRNLRTKVNAAVLVNMAASGGTEAAYYMHPSMEALLVTFNTIGQPLIYIPQNSGRPATLDGYPIRWIGVSQGYQTTAAASAYIAFFGDLSYWYLGERGAPRVEVSREVFYATDELAMRALERIDVEAMAIDAMAAMQTAAA